MRSQLWFGSLLLLFATSASAGPFIDKLAICLVKSATDADKIVLMRWIFSAMASHPNVRDLGNVSSAQGDRHNKDVAELFTTLVTDRCRAETTDAVKYEGENAISASFEVLGKVAMQGLMEEPAVSTYMGGVDSNLDAEKLREVFGTKPEKAEPAKAEPAKP